MKNILHHANNNGRNPRAVVRGFTLVELLVVMAIISLLISILLPSLGKAVETARNIQCLTNERSMFGYTNYYMSDNKDYIPMATQGGWFTAGGGNTDNYDIKYWVNVYVKYYEMVGPGGIPTVTTPSKTKSPSQCPSMSASALAWFQDWKPDTKFNDQRTIHYSMNATGQVPVETGLFRATYSQRNDPWSYGSAQQTATNAPWFGSSRSLKIPSQIYILVEFNACTSDVAAIPSNSTWGAGVGYRHLGFGTNLVFFDGHATTWNTDAAITNKLISPTLSTNNGKAYSKVAPYQDTY